MACSPGRCTDKFPWSLVTRPYQPPPGGWCGKELPPFVKDECLRWAWKSRSKAQNNSPEQAVEEVGAFLRQNGGIFTPEHKWLTSEHFDAQWCAADPDRCTQRMQVETESPVIPMDLPKSTMSWSRRFWETWNTLMASDHANPADVTHRWAVNALDLTASDVGCKHCHAHWQQLLHAHPPMAVIKSNPHARVWLWDMHQRTREGLPPIPYHDIQIGWRWPRISGQEVSRLLQEMGMAP